MNNSLVCASAVQVEDNKSLGFPIYILLFYLIAEYLRPLALAAIRPALWAQILLALYLLSNIKKMEMVIKDKYFKYYVALLCLMIVHTFVAMNNYWAFKMLSQMLSYLIIGASFCVFADNVRKLYLLISFFVLLMVICALDRISGIGFLGAVGHMGDENDFALAMNAALPISFFLGRAGEGRIRWFYWSATALFVFANMLSASRGGFLGMLIVAAICWRYTKNRFMALVIVAFLGILAWSITATTFKQEIRELGVETVHTGTGKDRIELWKIGWRAFLDHPVLGVGQGNMPLVMEKYQYDSLGRSYWKRGMWGRAIHSIYFTILPELGLVGLLILVLIFRNCLHKYRKIKEFCNEANPGGEFDKIESMNSALLVAIIGFMVTGAFLSALYYPEFWNLSMLLVALYMVTSKLAARNSTVA